MVAYEEDLVNAFQSQRLIYRGIQDNNTDKILIHQLSNDPVMIAMSTMRLVKPGSGNDVAGSFVWASKCLLFVMCCLQPSEEETPAAVGNGATKGDEGANNAKSTTSGPTPIGFVALFHREGESVSHHRNAMLGISIAAPYQGKGYGGEIINWTLDWGFRRAGLHRIHLSVASFNLNGLKLYRSLGFVEEGREREVLLYDRNWHDMIYFGMLEHEWEELRGISSGGAADRTYY